MLSSEVLSLSSSVFVASASQDAYLRGRWFVTQFTERSLDRAIECFQQALEIQPLDARAYSGLADCYAMLPWFGALSSREAVAKAKTAASRALAIDSHFGEAHCSLALVRFWYDWNWTGAEGEFLKAVNLGHDQAAIHLWYGTFLASMGRHQEAAHRMSLARELEPASPMVARCVVESLFHVGEFKQALVYLNEIVQRDRLSASAWLDLGRAYLFQRNYLDAIAALEKAVTLQEDEEILATLAYAYALAGQAANAQALLGRLLQPVAGRHPLASSVAMVYAGLGQTNAAVQWLEKGIEEHSCCMVNLNASPVFDGLRPLPHFQRLLQRLNFPGNEAQLRRAV